MRAKNAQKSRKNCEFLSQFIFYGKNRDFSSQFQELFFGKKTWIFFLNFTNIFSMFEKKLSVNNRDFFFDFANFQYAYKIMIIGQGVSGVIRTDKQTNTQITLEK